MPSFEVTSELIVAIAGAFLCWLFLYVPKLNTWYAALEPEIKRLIMLGLLVLVTGGIYAGTCAGIFNSGIACDKAGIWALVWMLIIAVNTNQATYKISPKTTAVRMAQTKARENVYTRLDQYLG